MQSTYTYLHPNVGKLPEANSWFWKERSWDTENFNAKANLPQANLAAAVAQAIIASPALQDAWNKHCMSRMSVQGDPKNPRNHDRQSLQDFLKKNPYPVSDLGKDTEFANEAIEERKGLLPHVTNELKTRANDLIKHTSHDHGYFICVVWAAEILVLLVIFMAMFIELWSSCPLELGIWPACRLCYSYNFLSFLGIWVIVYFLNLFVFGLLVAAGFTFSASRISLTLQDNCRDKNIPSAGVKFFIVSLIALAIWWIVGLSVLMNSNQCLRGGHLFIRNPRSELLWWTTLLTLITAPILLTFGRLNGK